MAAQGLQIPNSSGLVVGGNNTGLGIKDNKYGLTVGPPASGLQNGGG